MAVVHGPPTILVVEDDVDTSNALCEYLGYEGFDVAVARNGAEAIHLLDIRSPCAMLIDLTMPGITAEQLVAYRRGLDRLAGVPVAIVTAWPECAPAGFRVFPKPFDVEALIDFCNQAAE